MKSKLTFRKPIAWLLTLAMIFSILPVSVFATEDIEMDISETSTEVVCDCGTDDAAIHATTCAVYVAPENPVCYCAEKCSDVNEWCDICGFDYTACIGTDAAAAYAVGIVSTLDELKAAIQNGGEYMLSDSIHVPPSLTINTEIILHLNGKNITGDGEIFWVNRGTLTILGNGVLTNGVSDSLIYISGEGASVNIAGGTFEGEIYVGYGTCEISGGQIDLVSANTAVGITCTISGGKIKMIDFGAYRHTITGGSFGVDPTDYVDTENYTVTNNGDGTWTVTCNHIFGTDGKCTRCGAIDCGLAGHPGELENYTPTADGKHTATWSCCGTTVTEPHSITATGDRPVATCTAKAYCSVCNSEYGELIDHTPVEDATDNGNGTHNFTCSSCGTTVTENHNFESGVCTDCGFTGGYCGGEGDGTNLVWTLKDGVLTITGIGAMADYPRYADCPWYNSRETITALSIPEGVTNIGIFAFSQIAGLKSVTIPASVTKLGYCAFTNSGLETVTFAEGSRLTTIDEYAFQGCTALTEITLPAGVTSIGYRVFDRCTDLTDIHVAEGGSAYKSIDGVLYTADGTTLVCYPIAKAWETFTSPASVTTIGEDAFEYNSKLTGITLSEGVTTIGDYAFYFCEALTTVTIPASVTTIGDYAFDNCNALTTVNAPCTWDGRLYTFADTVTVNKVHTQKATYTLTEDGTQHVVTWSCCGTVVTEAHTPNNEIGQTCKGKLCTRCDTWYGEVVDHNWVDGECTYGCDTEHSPHDWNDKNGTCKTCGYVCDHGGENATYDNGICDICGEVLETIIVKYDEATKAATVTVKKEGTYSLIFAKYGEGNRLDKVDIVEFDFVKGINIVPQELIDFTLDTGDKIMLWQDMTNLVPLCEAYIVK